MSNKPETDLVKSFLDYLQMIGCVVTRVNSGLRVVEDDNHKNRRVFRGAKKGTSDIICCYRGKYVAIEAKIWPNVATPDQEEFLRSVREAEGIAVVAYSVEDINEALGIVGGVF